MTTFFSFPYKCFFAIATGALLFGTSSMAASAHERWFVPNDEQPGTDWGALLSLPTLLAVLAGGTTIVVLRWLQRRLGDPLWPRPAFFQRMEPAAPAILGVQAAVTLIFEASRLDLFAPNIELPRNVLGVTLAILAVVAAFSFITGMLTRLGAVIIGFLWLTCFAFVSPIEVFEQTLWLGIAIYLAAVGRGVVRFDGHAEEDRTQLTDRLLPWALPALRISVGISVLVLAFSETLLNVRLGELFLDEYPRFNVLGWAGIGWFTDARFILLIGIIETMAGCALIAGYLPRLVILGLWIPFNLGIAFLPPQELIGHLPILAAMYVLLVRGTEGVPGPEVSEEPAPPQRPAAEAAFPVQPGVQ
ncbi:MAG: hypothetical protein M9947_15925 [Thermomicrobiales bacterium]|nr:hypothetical protein [Thermomicrobiales bacterium]